MTDRMGARFKERETVHRLTASGGWLVVRVDGKAFHTYTRGMEKPFDPTLGDAMVSAVLAVCRGDMPSVLAYTQSDEASFVLDQRTGQGWFGSEVQKIVSVAASQFTAAFNRVMWGNGFDKVGSFDARVTHLDDIADVRAYVHWRRVDALRNSVSAAAHAVASRRALHGANVSEQKRVLAESGEPWEELAPQWQAGVVAYPVTSLAEVTYVDKRDGRQRTTEAMRTRWETAPMVDFDVNSWDRPMKGER